MSATRGSICDVGPRSHMASGRGQVRSLEPYLEILLHFGVTTDTVTL